MASPLMLATLAIIPALLVIGAAAFFIMRRRKDDENVAEPEGLDGEEPDMPVIMVPEEDDDSDELILEDDELEVTDDIDADDLFGDDMMDSGIDDINLSDSLELSDDEDEGGLDLDADTDLTSALDAALDDDFSSDLDVEPSTDGAIGLEDMERALDEMSMQPQESELSRMKRWRRCGNNLWPGVMMPMSTISMHCWLQNKAVTKHLPKRHKRKKLSRLRKNPSQKPMKLCSIS